MADSKRAFPLWEETKKKYVAELWEAQRLLVSYRAKRNPRDLSDLKLKCMSCWMNIRSYRDMLEKKAAMKPYIIEFEKLITILEDTHDFTWWAGAWMFLNDAYKRLGIDDVGKQEDEDDYKTAVLDGLFG